MDQPITSLTADKLQAQILALHASQPDSEAFWKELEGLSELASWKASGICLVLNSELFNLIDELLEGLISQRKAHPSPETDAKL